MDSPIAVAHGAGAVWVLFEESVKRYDLSGRETATIDLDGTDASFGDIAAPAAGRRCASHRPASSGPVAR